MTSISRQKASIVKGGVVLSYIGFLLTGPASNWLIQNVGTHCVPNGPCLIPVLPGISAPSGVLMVGLALVLRDLVHRDLGAYWALSAILLGSLISALFSPQALLIASTTAFLLSELSDFAVFAPLRRRGFVVAALVSSIVGLIVDSLVFLSLAFGSLDYLAGQVLGKLYMVLVTILIVVIWERRRGIWAKRPTPL